MQLLSILALTAPIYLLIALGYGVAWRGFIQREQLRALSWFIMYIGLPAVMYRALVGTHIEDVLDMPLFVVYGLGSLLPFGVALLVTRLRARPLSEAAIFALGSSLSNSLMIGFPILTQLFGDQALSTFAIILLVENLLIMPLALALADTGQQQQRHFVRAFLAALPALLRNPIIVAILCGLFSSLLHIAPPPFVMRAVDMLAATVGGVALFTIGGLLYGLKPQSMWLDLSQIGLTKLLVHPLGVMLMLLLFPGFPSVQQQVLLIAAAVPMFTILSMIGARYGLEAVCAAVLLPTVIASFFTINLFIWLLQHV